MRYRNMLFPNGKAKAMTFSYDDGCIHDIRLAEIFNSYGLKATFNLNGMAFDGKNDGWHLSADEIKNGILREGHEIAVHGQNHIAPGRASAIDGINDVLEGRKTLERLFGGIIRGMAYPDSGIRRIAGEATLDDIKTYVKMLGIVYSRTLGGDNDSFEIPTDWLAWMPTAHHGNPKLMEYLDAFLKAETDEPKLFYLWGHSFEFENNDNWDIIEDFCSLVSGHNDIWYATNIEIHDYTEAYRSLRFNVENTVVYNPTLFEIWFNADGKVYSVKSGEVLEIEREEKQWLSL